MKTLFISILFLTFHQHSFSQAPVEVLSNFFIAYQAKDADKAVDILYSSGPDVYGNRETLKTQLRRQIKNAGEYFGADLIATRTAGPRAVMYTYVVRHIVAPFTFRFFLYKPHDVWQLQSFKMDNDLGSELEEASKSYRSEENVRDIYSKQKPQP